MSALSPSPLLGGRFHLGEKLGASGGTETWRATEAGSDRICTVLLLETGGGPPEEVAERVRAASRVQHPSILPTLDVGVTADGRVFVVREQMPGGNLAAYVRRNGPLPPRKAAAVVRGLAAALDTAHAHGLVHGEVEPAKVSVGADNKPRLTGFGLMGVPPRVERPFAAPEAMEPSSVDARSDIYSAGATLFTLLTGKAPVGLSESELGEGALAAIPPALAQVIHRATRRDPRDRYESAAAMHADLKAIAVVLPPGSAKQKVASERAAPTIAISLDAPLPAADPGRDEETPTQLFDRDVIKMALGDLDRSVIGDLQPAIDAPNASDEPSVATMPAGGADLGHIEEPPVAMRERKQPPIGAIALAAIGVAACIALALYLGREPSSPPVPEVDPVPDDAAVAPVPPPRVETPPPPVEKPAPPPPETTAPPVAVKEPPKPTTKPRASSKKQPKIVPQEEQPIDVEDDGDMNPRITPTEPTAESPPADAPPTETPETEEQIWDAPPAETTPPADAAPTETAPADAPPTDPVPVTPEPAPAEQTPAEPPASEAAPAE
jgi:serine/threonine-protein kinase